KAYFSKIGSVINRPIEKIFFLQRTINCDVCAGVFSAADRCFPRALPYRYAFQLPQMEYTRFPGVADEPPCPGEGYVDVARKGRFSRPSSFTHSGVSPRPHLPQDKEGFGSDTSHAEKAVFFFKESRIFHLLA